MRPKRPGLSSLGRAVAVTTNHFRVACTRWVRLELSCSDTLQSVVSHWCWGILGACCIKGCNWPHFAWWTNTLETLVSSASQCASTLLQLP